MDISTVKEEWVNEGYDEDIVEQFFDKHEFEDDDEVTYKDERVLRKEFEKYSLNSSRKIRSSSADHSRSYLENVVKHAFRKYFGNTDLKYDPNKLILNEEGDEVTFAYDYNKSDPDEFYAMQEKIYSFEQALNRYGISFTEDDGVHSSKVDSNCKIRSSKVIKSAMDDETMWDAFEDIQNKLFDTLNGMSWLSKKGSRLNTLCEDLTAQIIGFDMDRDPSDILEEYYNS